MKISWKLVETPIEFSAETSVDTSKDSGSRSKNWNNVAGPGKRPRGILVAQHISFLLAVSVQYFTSGKVVAKTATDGNTRWTLRTFLVNTNLHLFISVWIPHQGFDDVRILLLGTFWAYLHGEVVQIMCGIPFLPQEGGHLRRFDFQAPAILQTATYTRGFPEGARDHLHSWKQRFTRQA